MEAQTEFYMWTWAV